jgi:hypothetical protein
MAGAVGLLLGMLLVMFSLAGPGVPLIVLGGTLTLTGMWIWLIGRRGRSGR